MDDRRLVKISKYLSKHLRHHPERIGLDLQRGGWIGVEELLAACAEHGLALDRAELDEVVARNDKRRFSYDETGTLIRANQGHSVAVDLGLVPVEPPEMLYHGTVAGAVEAIMRDGLRRMGRHHVHLSVDVETARRVAARRGRPVVLAVAAGRMARDGFVFLVSDNDVWLVDEVPAAYLATLGD